MQSINHSLTEFTITRKELMQLSRIGSIATYQKCIYELVQYGYIEYKPTFNAYVGTRARLIVRKESMRPVVFKITNRDFEKVASKRYSMR